MRIGLNLKLLEILSSYMPKDRALEAAKKIEVEMYAVRQSLKETIIREFRAVAKPEFTFPGSEKLPANTIALIDEKYDYQKVLDTPIEEIELDGIPDDYKEIVE